MVWGSTAPNWNRWRCCTPTGKPSRPWWRYHHLNIGKPFIEKDWTGSGPGFPACEKRERRGPPMRPVSGSPATGEPARAISKAYGGTCWGGLWDRLGSLHSGRFGDANLRTLQRRKRGWRGAIPQRLVYAVLDQHVRDLHVTPQLAPVGAGTKR